VTDASQAAGARPAIKATLWDFGGVISTSPFESFARYERDRGLPHGFIRTLNATNPDTNAWARFERNEVDIDGFATLFEAEARAAGGELIGHDVIACLAGDIRPEMVAAVRSCRAAGLRSGCVTNNIAPMHEGAGWGAGWGAAVSLDELFDVVIESSKIGVRKPDPRIYELACEALGVEPTEVVFLDDLGINLKPARAMGMHTIKVEDTAVALADLAALTGLALTKNLSG
jgi:putative hydrolase of the HAD superfamily